uniref:Putative ixodes 8-cys protein n=1 Tax=Ixodes ricinus TaxID=34613 RepID=A0A0K8R4X4_IXORI
MARLACVFLVFLLAYQCADVVNGVVKERDLPDYVGNKRAFLQRLKELCKKNYGIAVARVLLRGCRISCRVSFVFGRDVVLNLGSREPCSNDGRICVGGVCTHTS